MRRIPAWLAVPLGLLVAGCVSAPPLDGRSVTSALDGTETTRLGRAIAPGAAANPGRSGIYAIPEPRAAFAARAILAATAERSLDVQYYIWHGDETGYLLFEALWQAAERGVRVRLLLDDINTAGLDATIAALDAHPNVEVRLYNPVFNRNARALAYLTDFARLNRRMHNKSFTADNQATIVGGRNIGNEYFAEGGGVWFKDLDVVAVGPVVREVSASFDLYWASPSAYPAARLVRPAEPEDAAALKARFAGVRADPGSRTYLESLRETTLVRELLEGSLPLEWTAARVVGDDPAKTLDTTGRTDVLLLSALLPVAGQPEKSFDLVSPYFVPGEEGAAALAALAERGVKVRVLTNSLAATDVAAVHAGYAKRRAGLLRAGVGLYELKPSAGSGDVPEAKGRPGGSSAASLHAKTFAIDGRRVFVGSFNFDQRSALLNTEMGLLIESPALAARLARGFDDVVPKAAYEVRLAAAGGLEWIELTPSGEVRYGADPGTGPLRRGAVIFLSILPIEWLL